MFVSASELKATVWRFWLKLEVKCIWDQGIKGSSAQGSRSSSCHCRFLSHRLSFISISGSLDIPWSCCQRGSWGLTVTHSDAAGLEMILQGPGVSLSREKRDKISPEEGELETLRWEERGSLTRRTVPSGKQTAWDMKDTKKKKSSRGRVAPSLGASKCSIT